MVREGGGRGEERSEFSPDFPRCSLYVSAEWKHFFLLD